MEQPARYPIHLCQPDAAKSCGACCGLYNWPDHSRHTIVSLLQKNTELFFFLGSNPDIERYKRLQRAGAPQQKLFDTIYNCEFIGFLDAAEKRIGCLLHPCLHDGVELRECSFYGAAMCDGHFCPSYTYLTAHEQQAVVTTIDDWYLYGLVVTDIDFVKEFFTAVQNCLGESLHPEKLEHPSVKEALCEFFKLKECWKFASKGNRLGKYYFSQAEYNIARIEYEKNWDIKPSRFDKILLSLASEFQTREDIIEAEALIEENIIKFIAAYQSSSL